MGQLKQAMRERILHEVTYQRQMSDEEIAELIDGELMAYAGEIPLSLKERLALQRELFDSFRRLDILQELVDDPGITEIMVNGPSEIFVEQDGQLSFEERMGCGFGACMGCSCKTLTGNKRICKEGPVMRKGEILW